MSMMEISTMRIANMALSKCICTPIWRIRMTLTFRDKGNQPLEISKYLLFLAKEERFLGKILKSSTTALNLETITGSTEDFLPKNFLGCD